MPEPLYAIRNGNTLKTILRAQDCDRLIIPEQVTEVLSFGNLQVEGTLVFLPDGVTALPPLNGVEPKPLTVLMVRPGTPAEATARAGGWPYELIDEGKPGPSPAAPPEFELRGTTLVAYTGQAGEVTLPQGVTDVGLFAFRDNKALKRVILPEGVTTVHAGAFLGCTSLASVSLPESLREIRCYAFRGCPLNEGPLRLPEGLVTLGADALSDGPLHPLPALRLPKSLRGAIKLTLLGVTELEVPEGVESVNLTLPLARSVSLPQSARNVRLVLPEARSLTLPEGVGQLDLALNRVETLAIPEGVKTVKLFLGEVRELAIPQSARTVRLSLRAVRELVIPEGVEAVSVSRCESLERLELPGTLRRVLSFGFGNCWKLKSLRIPEGVRELPLSCFSGCYALERLELPASLELISDTAFRHDTGKRLQAVVAAPEGSYALEHVKDEGLNWEALPRR